MVAWGGQKGHEEIYLYGSAGYNGVYISQSVGVRYCM